MLKIHSKEELDVEVKKYKQVLALFYSSWCPYCIRFVPVFDRKISELPFEKVIHVIIDNDDNPLWEIYAIGVVPTVILFEDGKVSKRLDGRFGSGLKEQQFEKWLEQFKQT
jgi:thiol-disulfide isomerase/thioredoxin